MLTTGVKGGPIPAWDRGAAFHGDPTGDAEPSRGLPEVPGPSTITIHISAQSLLQKTINSSTAALIKQDKPVSF